MYPTKNLKDQNNEDKDKEVEYYELRNVGKYSFSKCKIKFQDTK